AYVTATKPQNNSALRYARPCQIAQNAAVRQYLDRGSLAPDRNSLQLHPHILMRVVSLTEQFHDNIRRYDTLRHVAANIRQVPWLIIEICHRVSWARYEEDFNPSDERVPIVFKFSEEAAQIVPTVDLSVLEEHDAVAGFRVRVQSFVSRDVEPIESCWHFSLLNFPQTLSCGYRTGKRGFALP